MIIKQYFQAINENLEKVLETQQENMSAAANMIANAAINDNCIYAFGSNHAGLLAQELFYRTGGLAIINPITPPGVSLDTLPVTLTTGIERLEGYGELIVDSVSFQAGDVLIVHSVSGRNTVSIDVAIHAKKLGVKVIGLTNMQYSKNVKSRHPSGKRLFEVCDLVLDNCGCHGDAVLDIPGLPEKVAPSSTVVGASILNAIVGEVVAILIAKDIIPPVFISSNVDGGDEHNKQVLAKYKDKIHYMKG